MVKNDNQNAIISCANFVISCSGAYLNWIYTSSAKYNKQVWGSHADNLTFDKCGLASLLLHIILSMFNTIRMKSSDNISQKIYIQANGEALETIKFYKRRCRIIDSGEAIPEELLAMNNKLTKCSIDNSLVTFVLSEISFIKQNELIPTLTIEGLFSSLQNSDVNIRTSRHVSYDSDIKDFCGHYANAQRMKMKYVHVLADVFIAEDKRVNVAGEYFDDFPKNVCYFESDTMTYPPPTNQHITRKQIEECLIYNRSSDFFRKVLV